MPETTQAGARTVVQVDGDKLAEALRRLSPFAAEKLHENLEAVYAEADGSLLQLTATDGFRMAHLTITMPFPVGNYLLKIDGVKDFSQRHYNGGQVDVGCFKTDTLKMGDVEIGLIATPYVDYPQLLPQNYDFEAVVDTKKWIKAIRGSGAEFVGVFYSMSGCKMYSQNDKGETIGCDELPVQMANGPDVKLRYKADHFRRALTSCGPTATIQVTDSCKVPEGKPNPTMFEADDYWHLLIPVAGFPREVTMTETDRQSFDLIAETVKAVRAGEVPGKLFMSGGKFYLEIGPSVTVTKVEVRDFTAVLSSADTSEPIPEAEEVANPK